MVHHCATYLCIVSLCFLTYCFFVILLRGMLGLPSWRKVMCLPPQQHQPFGQVCWSFVLAFPLHRLAFTLKLCTFQNSCLIFTIQSSHLLFLLAASPLLGHESGSQGWQAKARLNSKFFLPINLKLPTLVGLFCLFTCYC